MSTFEVVCNWGNLDHKTRRFRSEKAAIRYDESRKTCFSEVRKIRKPHGKKK